MAGETVNFPVLQHSHLKLGVIIVPTPYGYGDYVCYVTVSVFDLVACYHCLIGSYMYILVLKQDCTPLATGR